MAKILIVDDDSRFRETVQAILADEGHEAAIAENGEVAVQTFNSIEPNLIILDMLMPKLGGFDCASALRQTPLGKDIPIIFVSGAYKNAKIIGEAEEKFNAAAYLLKPFDASVLLDAIAEALGEVADKVEEKVATPLPESGSLLQSSVLSLLLRIDGEKHTGILDIFADKQRARLFFRRGRIVQAQINDPELNLGMALIRSGHLSPFDYKALLEHVEEQAVGLYQAIKDFKSVNGALVKETYKQLIPQIMAKTLALNGQFRWFDGAAFVKLVPMSSVHIMPAVIAALPGLPTLQLEPHLEPHKRMRLNKGPNWARAKQWLAQAFDEGALVLQSINGRARVGQIYGAVDDETKRQARMAQLFLLISANAVQLSEEITELEPSLVVEVPEQNIIGEQQNKVLDEDKFSQIPGAAAGDASQLTTDLRDDSAADAEADAGQSFSPEDEAARQKIADKFNEIAKLDYYAVLGVTREEFDLNQIKKNYFALARDFHSDSYSGRNLGSAARKLEAVFAKISEAYNTLSDEDKRGEYDAQLDILAQGGTADIGAILQAEGLLDKARLVMERGDLNSAFRFLEQAVALYQSPDIVAWHAYCGWRARGNQTSEADEILRIIIAQTKEAKIPRAFEFCAVIARYSGQFKLAKKMLRKAKNEDGDSQSLQRELRLIEKAEEEASKKGGLAGKLFGR